MKKQITKIKRAQTEPNQCDQFKTELPTQLSLIHNQNYLNVLAVDKAGMAEPGQMRPAYAWITYPSNGGSKLELSDSPSPGVQNLK